MFVVSMMKRGHGFSKSICRRHDALMVPTCRTHHVAPSSCPGRRFSVILKLQKLFGKSKVRENLNVISLTIQVMMTSVASNLIQ